MPGTWERREENVLVITDHFHQVCPGVCNKDPNGSDNGKDPVGQVHCPLWSSRKILTDQGRNFESQLVADLCELMGVQRYGPARIVCRLMVNVKDSIPL